jgi:hypothetical protein
VTQANVQRMLLELASCLPRPDIEQRSDNPQEDLEASVLYSLSVAAHFEEWRELMR